MELKENERIDDLQFKNLRIIQNEKKFCFGIDAVLLSDFAKNIRKNSTVVDLCSGTGIIAILLEGKSQVKKIYGVEIQEEMVEMASRSISLNHQNEKIEMINADLKKVEEYFDKASIDAITVNPPYKKVGSGITNEADTMAISRHEVLCTLEDVIKASAYLLNSNGSLFMVHRIERLVDVLTVMRKEKIEPKRIRMVHPSSKKAPNLFLIEGIKNAKPFLKVEPPIYVYDENGEYTDTIKEIYQLREAR